MHAVNERKIILVCFWIIVPFSSVVVRLLIKRGSKKPKANRKELYLPLQKNSRLKLEKRCETSYIIEFQ